MNAALTEELILEVPEQALVAVQVLVCRPISGCMRLNRVFGQSALRVLTHLSAGFAWFGRAPAQQKVTQCICFCAHAQYTHKRPPRCDSTI